jgi:hypothetical protein
MDKGRLNGSGLNSGFNLPVRRTKRLTIVTEGAEE